mmetsp:Transcript_15999/g.24908  ORF Transcript_15999/g.24908 Transcript_15999/m.24908 type:complete len:245 (+) Transcript_15999:2972-3706(+)
MGGGAAVTTTIFLGTESLFRSLIGWKCLKIVITLSLSIVPVILYFPKLLLPRPSTLKYPSLFFRNFNVTSRSDTRALPPSSFVKSNHPVYRPDRGNTSFATDILCSYSNRFDNPFKFCGSAVIISSPVDHNPSIRCTISLTPNSIDSSRWTFPRRHTTLEGYDFEGGGGTLESASGLLSSSPSSFLFLFFLLFLDDFEVAAVDAPSAPGAPDAAAWGICLYRFRNSMLKVGSSSCALAVAVPLM